MTTMITEVTQMDFLERYLQAVRFLLPKKQRHDIDQELSEELRSQIEEKEAELGARRGRSACPRREGVARVATVEDRPATRSASWRRNARKVGSPRL